MEFCLATMFVRNVKLMHLCKHIETKTENSAHLHFFITSVNATFQINFDRCYFSYLIVATTLDASNKTVKWDVVGDTKEFPNPFYKLIIRQILLGHTAKDNEYNVVEVSV